MLYSAAQRGTAWHSTTAQMSVGPLASHARFDDDPEDLEMSLKKARGGIGVHGSTSDDGDDEEGCPGKDNHVTDASASTLDMEEVGSLAAGVSKYNLYGII
ncbi:Hypothetical Protein FCC1311_113912, partial [Hondaea fermentalgiana]